MFHDILNEIVYSVTYKNLRVSYQRCAKSWSKTTGNTSLAMKIIFF